MLQIGKVCFKCNGEGKYLQERGVSAEMIDPCAVCDGSKYLPVYYLNTTPLENKLNSIEAKIDELLTRIPA